MPALNRCRVKSDLRNFARARPILHIRCRTYRYGTRACHVIQHFYNLHCFLHSVYHVYNYELQDLNQNNNICIAPCRVRDLHLQSITLSYHYLRDVRGAHIRAVLSTYLKLNTIGNGIFKVRDLRFSNFQKNSKFLQFFFKISKNGGMKSAALNRGRVKSGRVKSGSDCNSRIAIQKSR